MSRSPFLQTQPRRRRRDRHGAALAHRRRRRAALAAIALAVGAVVALALLVVPSLDGGGGGRRPTPDRPPSRAPTPAPSYPATTLAPLHLVSLAASPEPVAMRFAHEPSAGLLFDLDSGRVLWRRNPTELLPIASLTKMMTALVVVEHTKPDDPVLVTRTALAYRGSGIGLLPLGRHIPVETLLYGLLLPSGNDAAIALAEHVAGNVPAFASMMNEQAARLGLKCSHFTSPDGFDDGNRSCAADLAVLARADLDRPRIARIVASRSAVLPFPIKGGRVFLYNNNPLLRLRFPGTTGLKTGETDAAGVCLVETATRGRVRLGAIVLHSTRADAARQTRALLTRGFSVERASASR